MLEINEKIPEAENPKKADIKAGKIEFKNISFTYDSKLKEEDQQYVINNISFTVEAGQTVGIVGQTGSGKSYSMIGYGSNKGKWAISQDFI